MRIIKIIIDIIIITICYPFLVVGSVSFLIKNLLRYRK